MQLVLLNYVQGKMIIEYDSVINSQLFIFSGRSVLISKGYYKQICEKHTFFSLLEIDDLLPYT